MKSLNLVLLALILGLFTLGCDQDSTSSKDDLDVDPFVDEQVGVGWEINETVTVGKEIQNLTHTSDLFEEPQLDAYPGPAELKSQINRMYNESLEHLAPKNLHKITGDSLIYFEEDSSGFRSFILRRALYFDAETGRLRFYEVRTGYQEHHNLQYDSSEVVIYVGDDWLQPTHERIVELYRLQRFREDFIVQSIESYVEATEYEGDEITGVEITVNSYYHPDRRLVHRREFIQLNADGSGILRTEHEFSDGTTTLREVTFESDGTGTFTKERRDGTMITGTFDSVEDDLEGSYSELVDFPEGRYVDRILRQAQVMIAMPDSIFKAWFRETVYFNSGRVDSSAVAFQVEEQAGIRTTTISRTRPNGANGTFVVHEYEGEAVLTGYWITWDGYYVNVQAEYYLDGSGHLHYEVFTSEEAFLNEEEPLLVVDYHFSPDQSGSGTLVYEGVTYEVSFDGSGLAVISRGSKSRSLNVY